MKHLFLFLSILTIFNSCSDDGQPEDSQRAAELNTNVLQRMGDILPENSANEFDYCGQIHNDILLSYYSRARLPETVSQMISDVDSICNVNAAFTLIRSAGYTSTTSSKVNYIINLGEDCVDEILNSSGLSASGKTSLGTFVESLMDLVENEDDFAEIYTFIRDYESGVIASSLSGMDKEIILTTSSIARHSIFLKKKRPKKNTDPDWDLMTANIMAGTDGANTGTAEAINRAIVTGIADNK